MYIKRILPLLLTLLISLQQLPAQDRVTDINPTATDSSTTALEHYPFKIKRYILPAALIGVGVAGTTIDGMKDYHLISRKDSVNQFHLDDYLEWGMLGWVFACDLVGKEKHTAVDQIFLVTMAECMSAGMTHLLKHAVNETRPDGSPYSFPSGHTANAFLGAHIAFKEFKDDNMVVACSGYALGLLTAGLRLHNNRHWMCDVIAGAGFGILSAELAYQIYYPIKDAILRKRHPGLADNLFVAPILGDTNGFALTYRF